MDASDREMENFRQEVRAFLSDAITPDVRMRARRQAGIAAEPSLGVWWLKVLNSKGWAAPAWPVEYGGPGWDAVQRHIFEEEAARGGAATRWPTGLPRLGAGVGGVGPPERKAA